MSYKNEFKNCLDGLFESLCDVSDWMYENPELGFQEFKTSKYLVDYIQSNSKSVNYPSHGLETAFDITFGEEGPLTVICVCLLYTSPSPRDLSTSRMPSSA